MNEDATLNESILELSDITKHYKQGVDTIEVLSCINLKVLAGDTVAIIGCSGSGKSTLLHIAGLLDRPTQGNVFINGLSNISNKDRTRLLYIGFIYQYHYLLQDFTALENVLIPMWARGVSNIEEAEYWLKCLGLFDRRNHYPEALSGGQQQRVAIARALINHPKLILADEPTGNLDPDTAREVFELLISLAKKHQVAVIVVTHNHALAAKMDKIYELNHGTLTQIHIPVSTD